MVPRTFVYGVLLFKLAIWRATCLDRNVTKPIESLVFVSCLDGQKVDPTTGKYVSQDFWENISRDRPDALLWMGDTIYTKCNDIECIREGYRVQASNSYYKKVVESGVFIDGTWDDHDYGVNNGYKTFKYKKESKDLFLDFISVPKDSERRRREGVYSSHVFGPPGKQVKVIFLDTRYNRDGYYLHERCGIPQFAHLDTFITSVFEASLLTLASVFGCGYSYDGDMLGREQWIWLEKELSESEANVNIIVSSIQVTTLYPVTEGWGHFPESRNKLFSLISKTKAKGVLFLSGDVHFGQILELDNGDSDIIEVTSSGITHSIHDNIIERFAIGLTLPLYSKSKLKDGSKSFSLKRNYGRIEFRYNENDDKTNTIILDVTIRDMEGKTQIHRELVLKDDAESNMERLEHLRNLPHVINKKTFKQVFGRACILVVLALWGLQIFLMTVQTVVISLSFVLRPLNPFSLGSKAKRD
ncbi:phosphodiesterase/alkaline phosphatase D [Cryptosporidium ryanae]|uniref:phosphodiesterase/alkaline phosphatase D n=1 Tax=Cryptosporidium ryanae TaxID=515981 RepID=UPI00351AAA78|nr:phosphodiesterase/alkaline phosphatase D [Cryptosporidium ryanae]